MSQLLDKCKKCVDHEIIDWNKTRLPKSEKRALEEHIIWGIVHLALYILSFDEYNQFKRYIYEKYGYDPGGVTTGQMNIFEVSEHGANDDF